MGQAVEGNFGGDGDWFPGKIDAVNGDGTHVVLYDDGDSEAAVMAENLRAVGGGGGGSAVADSVDALPLLAIPSSA